MNRVNLKRISLFCLTLIFLYVGCSGKSEAEIHPEHQTETSIPETTALTATASASVLTAKPVPTTTASMAVQSTETPLETERILETPFASAAILFEDTEEPIVTPEEEKGETTEAEENTASSNLNPPYTVLELLHDGIEEKQNAKAVVDYSHIEDGYFMFRRLADTDHRYKVLVKAGGKTYQYNIDHGDWCAFPCSEGDGSYNVQVMENVSGTKYANVLTASFKVKLLDPFSPFLRPNLNVNYVDAPNTMAKGAELTEGCEGPLEKVDKVYEFVIGNIHYDYILAATVETGYTPDLDRVLSRKRGICYDYSSLMTAMLRSQNVPTKLIFGYVGKIYHAWISVWVDEVGWVEAIYFDGKSWIRMDPTFAAAGTTDATLSKYIGKGNNYAVKFSY